MDGWALQVDTILGTNIFLNGYSKSPVVYGAFPSMHCGELATTLPRLVASDYRPQ
jgi:hypothetical protein